MKKLTFALLLAVAACGGSSKSSTTPPPATAPATADIVDTAVGAGSFTTLVAAVQAAGRVRAGDLVVMASAGVSYAWGAYALRWG